MRCIGLQTNTGTLALIAAPIELSEPISNLKSTDQNCPPIAFSGGAA